MHAAAPVSALVAPLPPWRLAYVIIGAFRLSCRDLAASVTVSLKGPAHSQLPTALVSPSWLIVRCAQQPPASLI
jgi:hypothetical protein